MLEEISADILHRIHIVGSFVYVGQHRYTISSVSVFFVVVQLVAQKEISRSCNADL